jgi:hypothetical protein
MKWNAPEPASHRRVAVLCAVLAALVVIAAWASQAQAAAIGPLTEAKTAYVAFDSAPFPYRGLIADSGNHFIDRNEGNRLGHFSTRDNKVHWEDEIYKDNRVLLYIPAGFDIRKPALIVVFFHGNGATLERDVMERQRVAEQVANAHINAVLVAPQLAVDAPDSSAGAFWRRGNFAKFVAEAATRLTALYGDRRLAGAFTQSDVLLVAYSGGFLPAAWSLAIGKANLRVRGVVLLDAMYGEIDRFVDYVEKIRPPVFFITAHGDSSRDGNDAFEQEMNEAKLRYSTTLPKYFARGGAYVIDAGSVVKHEDFVTAAWVENPITWILSRIPGYPLTH